jgi:hypothetical protein
MEAGSSRTFVLELLVWCRYFTTHSQSNLLLFVRQIILKILTGKFKVEIRAFVEMLFFVT